MPAEHDTLRITIVPGVTVAKWTKAWQERRSNSPLAVIPVDEGEQLSLLRAGQADIAFVRLPIERDGLSVIRLYSEVAVVVVAKEHPISLFESVTEAELGEEIVRPEAPADAVEVVAAGVGVLRVPHSVARLHARKDTVAVPVSDAEQTEIAVVWLEDALTADIEEFVGIVRGRRPGSSRGTLRQAEPDTAAAPQKKPTKPQPKQGGGGSARSGGKAKAKPAAKRPAKQKARGKKRY